MTDKQKHVITDFRRLADERGWELKEIGERWGLSDRQMSRISAEPKQLHLDALNGLQIKEKKVKRRNRKKN